MRPRLCQPESRDPRTRARAVLASAALVLAMAGSAGLAAVDQAAPAAASDVSATPAARIEAIRAIQADPNRDAIGQLVRLLGTDLPPEVRAATLDALVARSGRDDLGASPQAWAAWWKETSFLPEGDWRLRLAEAQSARAGRLQSQRDAALRRLTEALPRLHALTPDQERSDLIAGLIRDEIPEVSRLGIDLASRALLNAQTLGDSVRDAALVCLSRPSPDIRAGAARLLEHLAPDAAAAPALAALQTETDDRAAQALLRILAVQPLPGAAEPALQWLARPGAAREGAAEVIIALSNAGLLNPRDRQQALGALRGLGPAAWTPPLVRLLGAVGSGDADLTMLVELATTTTGAPQDAAMEALVASDAGLAMAEAAVRGRPSLVEPLARAIRLRRASAAGFWAFLRCTEGQRLSHPATMRVLGALDPNDVEAASMLFTDAAERNDFLTMWLESRAGADPHPDAGRIWLSAAHSRLSLGDGPGTLEALDRSGPATDRTRDLRAAALLCSGCPDLAAQFSRDYELWLRTLERWGNRPGLRGAIDGMVGVLGPPTSEDQADRLSRIASAAER